MKHFIFYHGFGFSKNFWKNLSVYFINEKCTYLDSGYFNHQYNYDDYFKLDLINDKNTKLIGIGHSLGFIKLLNLNIKFDYIIGLNSFIQFLGNNPLIRKKREKELKALKINLINSPKETMKNFYQKCGVPDDIENLDNLNLTTLINDLGYLSKTINFILPDNTLILGAKDDVIVPSSLLYDNFNQFNNVKIKLMENGKHSLGFLEDRYLSDIIINFTNDIR